MLGKKAGTKVRPQDLRKYWRWAKKMHYTQFLTWKKYAKKLDMTCPLFTLPQGNVCIMRKLIKQIPFAIQELNNICVENKNTTTLTMTHSNVLVISRSELVKKVFARRKNKMIPNKNTLQGKYNLHSCWTVGLVYRNNFLASTMLRL